MSTAKNYILFSFIFASQAFASSDRNIKPDVERLLHRGGAIMNAFQLDEMGLSQNQTTIQPWTSSYWPDSIGGIANRYQKKLMAGFGSRVGIVANFNLNKGAWKDHDEKTIKKVMKMDEKKIARDLSPSEKYDLLMGDMNFTLTNNVIDEIQYRFDHKQDANTGLWIEKKGMMTWVGICDGWTAASLHIPRPVKTIQVVGATGQTITFYPDDLKALASQLFARANQWMNIEREGSRCRDKKPKRDEFGRPAKDECHDIDAGLWHTTVMNRIGIDKRGFIIDVDNKSSVNNHPVFGYEAYYFNPITGVYDTLKNSVVALSEMHDGLEPLRNKNATKVVGVEMHLDLLTEDFPKARETDGPEDDHYKQKITYVYDIEMNDQGDIVGGQFREGYKRGEPQPDMLWMLAKYQLAWSRSSAQADEGPTIDKNKIEIWGNINWRFKGDGKIPADWLKAHYESAKLTLPGNQPWAMIQSPAPLAEMVYYLFDQARE